MKRRELLYVTGTTGMLAVAGCVGEGSDDESEEQATGDGDDDGDGMEESDEDGGDEEEADGPLGTARAFLDAFEDADGDGVNELLHEDGELDPLEEDEAEELSELTITASDLELENETEESALVTFVLSIEAEDGEEEVLNQEIELVPEDGEWRVWDFRRAEEPTSAPRVQFDVDRDDGELVVTHTGGDHVLAENLFIRGEGLAETGSWLELGGDVRENDDHLVTAGHSLRVGVEDTYELRLVWDDGDELAALYSVAGDTAREQDIDAPEAVLEYLEDTDNFSEVVDGTEEETVTVLNGELENGAQPFGFEPAAVRVAPGTDVTWEWVDDGAAHSVTHEADAFDSGVRDDEDAAFTHTFEEPGIYLYYCAPHRALEHKGAIIVGEIDDEESER